MAVAALRASANLRKALAEVTSAAASYEQARLKLQARGRELTAAEEHQEERSRALDLAIGNLRAAANGRPADPAVEPQTQIPPKSYEPVNEEAQRWQARILDALELQNGQSTKELTTRLGCERHDTLRYHLQRLREAGRIEPNGKTWTLVDAAQPNGEESADEQEPEAVLDLAEIARRAGAALAVLRKPGNHGLKEFCDALEIPPVEAYKILRDLETQGQAKKLASGMYRAAVEQT